MLQRKFSRLGFILACITLSAGNATAGGHKSAEPAKDIVATAISAGSFGTLVAAVEAAGLVETLQGDGPFTVWAPTDEAFAALPEGTVENLLKPENKDQLQAILLYHVVPGKANAEQVKAWSMEGTTVETAQGGSIEAKSSDDGITINGANVVKADVAASNGVIHVIDAVLLPPES